MFFSSNHKKRTSTVLLSAAAMALVWGGLTASALAKGKGGGKADTTAPAAVTDLRVILLWHDSITLGWTATGDDAARGTASTYDIRYSIEPITEENFADPMVTTQVECPPMPRAAGTPERFTVLGL